MNYGVWMRNHWLYFALGFLFLLAGGAGGWFLHENIGPLEYRAVRDSASGYKLISPFLYLETTETTQPRYLALRSVINAIIDDAQAKHSATQVAVYYRDLNSSEWFGIHSTDAYALASMLKVVTALSVLHYLELHPDAQGARITLDPNGFKPLQQAYYPPQHPVVAGQTYSVEELLWHDLVESDNNAEAALESYIGVDTLKQTFADLHLPVPPSTVTDYDTPQEYSHLFRVLYGSTYLTRENSQKVLDLLTRTNFDKGLAAGVPTGTIVAHKFGENIMPTVPSSTTTGSPVLELHDCGIVYYPNHPYFLCVTTKGSNFDDLAGVIKDISASAWKATSNFSK